MKLRRALVALMALSMVAVSPLATTSVQAAVGNFIDTQDRAAVVAAYEAEFNRTEPAHNWSGNTASCTPGTTSAAFRNSVFSRVNWYRSMAGVPASITEEASLNAASQESALMMSATGSLSHSPGTNFSCYTTAGAQMAGQSNLALGLYGISAIDAYIEDAGANNIRAGHRNWILHPPAQKMATGDIVPASGWNSNSLYVFDNTFGAQPIVRENQGFVAWPPRGFVPGEAVYPRWSFGLRGADMSGAQVSVSSGGNPLAAPVIYRSGACSGSCGAPFPIVVFEPAGVNTAPAVDTTYSVIVTGVKIGGVVQPPYTYTVAVLGATAPPADTGNCRQGPPPAIYSTDDVGRASVYRLYCAYFLRYPDLGGYDYWYGVTSTGTSYKVASDSFELGAEFVNTYGSLNNSQFLDLIYANVLERAPDASGYQYWLGLLNTGQVTKGDAMLFFSVSAEFKTKTGTQ